MLSIAVRMGEENIYVSFCCELILSFPPAGICWIYTLGSPTLTPLKQTNTQVAGVLCGLVLYGKTALMKKVITKATVASSNLPSRWNHLHLLLLVCCQWALKLTLTLPLTLTLELSTEIREWNPGKSWENQASSIGCWCVWCCFTIPKKR